MLQAGIKIGDIPAKVLNKGHVQLLVVFQGKDLQGQWHFTSTACRTSSYIEQSGTQTTSLLKSKWISFTQLPF